MLIRPSVSHRPLTPPVGFRPVRHIHILRLLDASDGDFRPPARSYTTAINAVVPGQKQAHFIFCISLKQPASPHFSRFPDLRTTLLIPDAC